MGQDAAKGGPDSAAGLVDLPGASPVVVELFTSQGCSSCPPADALFAQMADDPGVIALSLHVDYWDYLGWQDGFGQAAFTQRQKAYAKAARERMVYTPQAIVDGQARVVGSDAQGLMSAVMGAARADRPLRLTLEVSGDEARISAQTVRPLPGPVDVQLVRYAPKATIEITHGENAGLTVTYRNVVSEWQDLGQWTGESPLDLTAPAPGGDGVVVILQAADKGPILAAARAE